MPTVIAKREKAFDQGELIKVPVPGKPGQSIKMTRAEAKARGLLVETKEKKPTRNKSKRTYKKKTEEVNDG